MSAILDISAANYQAHAIHGDDRIWTETNCYVDVLVELIHALGYDPVAALPFSLAIDFEEDQWTFFKYPPGDMLDIYGFDLQELNPWDELAGHVATQVSRGYPVLVELDSWYLPDTAGSAYKIEHVKSTVAVNAIDLERKFLGYFHGQGYYELQGEDFEQIFQTRGLAHERMLPPYIEFIKLRSRPDALSQTQILERSLVALRRQLRLLPNANPFETFRQRLEQILPSLTEAGMDTFHKYSFATFRQFGACFELAATYVAWLEQHGESGLQEARENYLFIAETVKAMQFQFARAMARKKALDLSPMEGMARAWQYSSEQIKAKYLATDQ